MRYGARFAVGSSISVLSLHLLPDSVEFLLCVHDVFGHVSVARDAADLRVARELVFERVRVVQGCALARLQL